MMRPIAIMMMCALLGGLIYSQRHMFIDGIAQEVQKKMGAGLTDTVVVNSGSSMKALLSEGQKLFDADDFKQAEVVFLKAIAIDSLTAEPFAHLGLIRSLEKNYDSALEFWTRAVQNDPDNLGYRINLGRAYAQVGQKEDAIAQWQVVLEKDPYHETAKELIAKVVGE